MKPSVNARRQAAFSERMRAAGRKRVSFWVTRDEERMIRNYQASFALEAESGVQVEPGEPYRTPTSLDDFTVKIIPPQLASKLVRLWHSVLPYI